MDKPTERSIWDDTVFRQWTPGGLWQDGPNYEDKQGEDNVTEAQTTQPQY